MSFESMSVENMKKYMGTNPRPTDFDRYWEESLEEIAAWDPSPRLVPAAFRAAGAECFDLYYSGADGAQIHAKYLRPAGRKGKIPVIYMFHGYSGNSGDWWDKLAWISQGFAVAVMDCRGQAGLSEDRGNVNCTTYHGHIIRGLLEGSKAMLFRQIFMDTALLVKAVKNFPETDSARMAVHGGSQGGGLSLVCAALVPEIRCAAVLYPFLCDYRRVWELNCRGSAYEELEYFFRAYDPRHEQEEEYFTRLGYIDVQYLVPRIRAKVLWGMGLKDEACPASTQFAAYNRLKTEKQLMLYPDFGHEGLPGFIDECVMFLSSNL